MTCDNYHAEKVSPDCPFCVIRILTLALERHDPFAPELTPAMALMHKAEKERARARRASRETL